MSELKASAGTKLMLLQMPDKPFQEKDAIRPDFVPTVEAVQTHCHT